MTARVMIPRIRNGKILEPVRDDAKERARLLGLYAVVIAEATNYVVHFNLGKEFNGDPELARNLEARVYRRIMLDTMHENMQVLMDNDYETFKLFIKAYQAQYEAERDALSVFKSFLRNEEPLTGKAVFNGGK
jgi:hypothetical protein